MIDSASKQNPKSVNQIKMVEKKSGLDKSELDTTSVPYICSDDISEECCSKTVVEKENKSFLAELRYNKVTRFNVLLSVYVAFSFSMLGWRRGQTGPAFLDIIHISGTDLERGSAFKTSFFAGNILGSIFCGVFYSKINRYSMLTMSSTINSLMLAIIPWCFRYESMITVHAIHGICNGVMSVVLSAVAVGIWGATARGRVYLNIFYASFSASGLISPIITSPFLLSTTMDVTKYLLSNSSQDKAVDLDLTTDYLPIGINMSTIKPIEHANTTQYGTPTSKISVAFSISAGLTLVSTIPFVILYFKSPKNDSNSLIKNESQFIGNNLPVYVKVLQLLNIGIFSTFYMSLQFTFSGYLATFCVQHLQWTKTLGALLTSALFLAMLGGRIFGAYLSHFLKPIKMLALSTLFNATGLFGLSISGLFKVNVGIWISVCVIGVALSLMWPSLLSWTNENLIPVRGKITTYLLLTGFIGALLSPLLFGYMMEERSPIWFCFLNLAKAVGAIINVILMFLYTRSIRLINARIINVMTEDIDIS